MPHLADCGRSASAAAAAATRRERGVRGDCGLSPLAPGCAVCARSVGRPMRSTAVEGENSERVAGRQVWGGGRRACAARVDAPYPMELSALAAADDHRGIGPALHRLVIAPGLERLCEDAHRRGAPLRGGKQRLRGLRLDGVELQLNRQPVVLDRVQIGLARQCELRLDRRAGALRPRATVAGRARVLGDEAVGQARHELVVERLLLHPPPRLEQRRELEPRLQLRVLAASISSCTSYSGSTLAMMRRVASSELRRDISASHRLLDSLFSLSLRERIVRFNGES
eukprot:scaffold39816_cov42-Phaeocystis_antarctica.AAC.1